MGHAIYILERLFFLPKWDCGLKVRPGTSEWPPCGVHTKTTHGEATARCPKKTGAKYIDLFVSITNYKGLSEHVGYIPNEIAIFHRDNDQQNHWVFRGTLFSDTPINPVTGDFCRDALYQNLHPIRVSPSRCRLVDSRSGDLPGKMDLNTLYYTNLYTRWGRGAPQL